MELFHRLTGQAHFYFFPLFPFFVCTFRSYVKWLRPRGQSGAHKLAEYFHISPKCLWLNPAPEPHRAEPQPAPSQAPPVAPSPHMVAHSFPPVPLLSYCLQSITGIPGNSPSFICVIVPLLYSPASVLSWCFITSHHDNL